MSKIKTMTGICRLCYNIETNLSKMKKIKKTIKKKSSMINISLDGKWKVKDETLSCKNITGLKKITKTRSGWLPAIVPGEIHLDLMRAGRLDEPLVGLNARESRWPEKRSWWFVKSFEITASFIKHERQQLVFDGLDLYAQVFLNGTLIGESKNAFVPCVFDVNQKIRKGKNILVVRLTSGAELLPKALRPKAANKKDIYGERMKFPGINHLRKPQFTYGWDWVDALPNIGIWRGVHLEAHSGIVLHDVNLDTQIEKNDVLLNSKVIIENLHPWSERNGNMELIITSPSKKKIIHKINFDAQVGRSTLACKLKIPNPQLWWPNGMGDQPLYHVTVSIVCDEKVCDKREMNIGLRTVEIDSSASPVAGKRFCIRVNGHDIFCKGGNWIPADAIIARVDKKKYDTLIAEAQNANINMLRIWGGGVYESPDFYNACDRRGILIWQDFMFACSEYPDYNADFRSAIRDEVEKVVMSLRHHPCIALWCGNNENVWGFDEWWNNGKSFSDKNLKLGGSILYNRVLPDVCQSLDPKRPYWPGSPCGGEAPNSETAGDCHWWMLFTMNKDINRRIAHEVFDECKARFVSEYGVIGPCHLDSIKQYLSSEELYVGSRAWKEHTNQHEKDTTPAGIRRHYTNPEKLNISDYILYGQMFQALMYGKTIEALRFRKNDQYDDCQGALIWMYNDCWGETGWTPIDYYLRRKPSYYWIRNANAQVKTIVRQRGKNLVTRVVNDTLKQLKLSVHYGWMRVDGSDSKMKSKAFCIDANSMVEIGSEMIAGRKVMDPREWIYTAYIAKKNVVLDTNTWLLVPYRELAIPDSDIRVTVKGKKIQLISKTYCHGVHFRDNGKAVLSDNYFDLLPGVPKSITCLNSRDPKKIRFHTLFN